MAERILREAALPPHVEENREPPPAPDDVDLRPYLKMLWAFRVLILGTAVLLGAGAFFLAWRTPRVYEATTILSISQSKLTDTGVAVATANFRPVVTNRGVAQKILADFGLDRPPYSFSPASFLENAVQLDEVRNTGLLRLSVRLNDPVLAARVANALAERAVQFSQTLSQDEAVRLRDLIKTQLDLSAARMKRASDALVSFQRTAQIDLARIDVEALLEQRKEILGLTVDVEAGRAKVAAAEAELEKLNRLDVTTRTISDDPALLEASRARVAPGTSALGLEMKTEAPSPEYQSLARELALARMDLAEAEKRRQQLVDRMRLDAPQIAVVRDLHEKDSELRRLEMDFEIAQKAYSEVASRYEGARLQVAGHSAEIQVIDPALPPDRPLSRQVVSRTVTAGASGLALGAVLAILIGVARRPASPQK